MPKAVKNRDKVVVLLALIAFTKFLADFSPNLSRLKIAFLQIINIGGILDKPDVHKSVQFSVPNPSIFIAFGSEIIMQELGDFLPGTIFVSAFIIGLSFSCSNFPPQTGQTLGILNSFSLPILISVKVINNFRNNIPRLLNNYRVACLKSQSFYFALIVKSGSGNNTSGNQHRLKMSYWRKRSSPFRLAQQYLPPMSSPVPPET